MTQKVPVNSVSECMLQETLMCLRHKF